MSNTDKHFYSIHYYFETLEPKFWEVDRFYGTLEDMFYMIHQLVKASFSKKITYVEITGLDVRYTHFIDVTREDGWGAL